MLSVYFHLPIVIYHNLGDIYGVESLLVFVVYEMEPLLDRLGLVSASIRLNTSLDCL